MKYIFSILLFTSSFLPLGAVDYYVASDGSNMNDGSEASPWLTLQHAANIATPGSTVFVKAGEYREKISINVEGNERDGSIVFRNYQTDKVVVSGKDVPKNPISESDDIILIQNKSYLSIVGFEIRDLQTVEGSGIRFLGSGSHIEIIDNEIHNLRGGGPEGGAMGITIYGSNNDVPVSQISIKGNKVYDCDAANSEALTLNGNIVDFYVLNNEVHDINNIGIDFIGGEDWLSKKHARFGVCAGNKVYRARSVAEGGFAAGIYVDGGSNIVIVDNEVYECDLGIEIGAENPGVITSGIVVFNNYIHDNDKGGLVFGGYKESLGRVVDSLFIYNKLVNNDVMKAGFGEIWVQYATGNHVFLNSITAGPQNLMICSYEGNSDNVFDFDNFCSASGKINEAHFIWNGVRYEGLSNFREGTGQEMGATFCNGDEKSLM